MDIAVGECGLVVRGLVMRLISIALLALAACHAVGIPSPNIVLILADDFETSYKQDHLALMPNLLRLRERGISFDEHIAVDPLCGPSRGALLSGRYPHNNGYRHNIDSSSISSWLAIQNNSVGTWVTHAGYRTQYLGKYLNGLETHVPSGWSAYGGFDGIPGTYSYYSALQFNVTFDSTGEHATSPITSTSREGSHQGEFLGAQTVSFMSDAVSREQPFFIHVAPVMVHYGTCEGPFLDVLKYAPTDPFWEAALEFFGCPNGTMNDKCDMEMSPCVSKRNAHVADGMTNPRTPAWGVTASGGTPPSMRLPPATAYEVLRQDVGFRNRTGSALDLDNMLGVILDGLDALGPAVADNTWVIFTSDNVRHLYMRGAPPQAVRRPCPPPLCMHCSPTHPIHTQGYHLNEHRLIMGKEHPYSTDVKVPLIISGPGVPANTTAHHPTTHVDLTATIVALAGATPVGPPLDGLSFVDALTATPVAPHEWRTFSFAENAGDETTWVQLRRPLPAADDSAAQTTFHWWCSNVSEVFDLAGDVWQLANIANATPRGAAVARAALPLALALAQCAGENCSRPQPLTSIPPNPLPCYKTNRTI